MYLSQQYAKNVRIHLRQLSQCSKTQIWIVISSYLLIAIFKKELGIREACESANFSTHFGKLTKQVVMDALQQKLEPIGFNQ